MFFDKLPINKQELESDLIKCVGNCDEQTCIGQCQREFYMNIDCKSSKIKSVDKTVIKRPNQI